ncbi:DUF2651 family protein [Bacillus sp. Marseille-Q1617]|uniref:DUF2651 family protein n=1 Tax=Bacillus sp. Marseille-Q1617 TaxID=2736887 RepID=UPI00158DA306|nr:DUF2651 family protein [Bacillus sp. Marseille-Q1617]
MNIFFLILIFLPFVSSILGVLGFYIFKNIYTTPALVFISGMIAMYLLFNETFLMWVFVYTLVALLSGWIIKGLRTKMQNRA